MSEATIPIDKARDYILAGNATVIFINHKTGNTYKFKIKLDGVNERLWWVNTLIKDPKTGKPYLVGTIAQEYNPITIWKYTFTASYQYISEVQIFKDVFKAMWQRIVRGYWKKGSDEDKILEIMHDGTCFRCGRQLTDEKSVKSGFGAECRSILGIQI